MQDPHLVWNVAQLREVIPDPNPAIQQKIAAALDANARRFIAESPLLFVATSDRLCNLDVSPKGDIPGFVHVADPTTLLIPERSGNRLAYGFQNVFDTQAIALIFLVPGVRETLRINGTAAVTRDPVLLQRFAVDGKPALLVTRVTVRECFFHCGKALIRSKLWAPESWSAATSRDVAVKSWAKRSGMAESALRDVLEQDYRDNL